MSPLPVLWVWAPTHAQQTHPLVICSHCQVHHGKGGVTTHPRCYHPANNAFTSNKHTRTHARSYTGKNGPSVYILICTQATATTTSTTLFSFSLLSETLDKDLTIFIRAFGKILTKSNATYGDNIYLFYIFV